MSRVRVCAGRRVTASLHGATGTVTNERNPAVRVDTFGRNFNYYKQPEFWVQFDEPQRGAGSVMVGVWLEKSMFETAYKYKHMTDDELRQEAEMENAMMNGAD